MRDDDNEDGIEIDGALVLFDGDGYDMSGAAGYLIAQATELATDGAESEEETSRRVLQTLLVAAVECAHKQGLSEEAFGDAIVESWCELEESSPAGETLN